MGNQRGPSKCVFLQTALLKEHKMLYYSLNQWKLPQEKQWAFQQRLIYVLFRQYLIYIHVWLCYKSVYVCRTVHRLLCVYCVGQAYGRSLNTSRNKAINWNSACVLNSQRPHRLIHNHVTHKRLVNSDGKDHIIEQSHLIKTLCSSLLTVLVNIVLCTTW